jgi:hypothetical protein
MQNLNHYDIDPDYGVDDKMFSEFKPKLIIS